MSEKKILVTHNVYLVYVFVQLPACVRYKAVKLIIGGVAVRRCHAVQVCQSLVFDLAAENCSYPCKGLILLNWGPRIRKLIYGRSPEHELKVGKHSCH